MHMTQGGVSRPIVRALGLLALGAGSSFGQLQPRLVVSTTSNVSAADSAIGEIDDGSLTHVGDGAPIRPMFGAGHWLAVAGFVPGDIDAFGRRVGSSPGSAESIAFSLLSNEGGFLDGDILGLDPGAGTIVLISEFEIAFALGMADASIDVDALSFDNVGRLYFSLQADLNGTLLGDLTDGDILRLDGPGTCSLIASEAQVQAQFSAATGLSDSIGDVQGIDWFGGEVWVATQSPSSHDGGVFRALGTPEIIIEESQVGLGGAELDALSVVRPGEEIVSFTLSAAAADPGDTLQVEAFGAPGELLFVLPAGAAGYVDFSMHPGFAGFYLDPLDPWLQSVLAAIPGHLVVLDGAGRYSSSWSLPSGMAFGPGLDGDGWSVQVLALTNRELSAPWRISRL